MASTPIRFTFEGDTSDLEKALGTLDRRFNKTKKNVEDVGKSSKKSAEEVSFLGPAFDRAAQRADNLFKVHGKALGAVGAAVGVAAVGVAAVVKSIDLAIGAVQKLAEETFDLAQAGDEVAKAAKRVGTSAEELQIVRFALGEGGVAAEQADMAMLKLNLRLAQVAETGKGPAAEALKKLGLEAKDLQALPLPERMAKVADAFSLMESQGDKTAAAVSLMEEGGLRLLSAFEDGGDAIRDSAAAIERIGVISNESAAASERLVDAVGRLNADLNSLQVQVLNPLIPVLEGYARGISEIIRNLDSDEVKEFSEVLAGAISDATIALAGFGIAAETAFAAAKPALQGLAAVTMLTVNPVLSAKLALEALTGALDVKDAIEEATNRWVGWSETVQVEIAKAVFAAERGAKKLGNALGGGGGGGGGLTLGPSTDIAIEDDETAGGDGGLTLGPSTDITIEDVPISERIAEWAQNAINELEPIADKAMEIASSISSMFGAIQSGLTQSIREGQDELNRLQDDFENEANGRRKMEIQAEARALRERIEQEKEAARASFAIQKAVAISEAVIMGALAVLNALATGGAAAIPLSIAAGITAGVSVATIAAEPPPSFHSGGMVAAAAPDEITARLLRSEAVLSPQGVAAAGGESGVRDLNRGGAGVDRPIVSVLQVRSRTVDAMISDNLRTRQGPLTDALRAARPRALGRHNPFASS